MYVLYQRFNTKNYIYFIRIILSSCFILSYKLIIRNIDFFSLVTSKKIANENLSGTDWQVVLFHIISTDVEALINSFISNNK